MTEWSGKQMIGDRVKRRLGRMRAYKRIGILEGAVAGLGQGPEVRQLSDEEIKELRDAEGVTLQGEVQ
jgi:hypothetical protein